jgi:predicted acyltransferase
MKLSIIGTVIGLVFGVAGLGLVRKLELGWGWRLLIPISLALATGRLFYILFGVWKMSLSLSGVPP